MTTNSTTSLSRLASILKPGGPIPVSRSTWWAGVKSGRFPAPIKLGPRITAWRDADIQELVKSGLTSLNKATPRIAADASKSPDRGER